MKYENEVKELLINNTIQLIADGGFELATVKNLTNYGGTIPGFKMNDVYIYRLFGGKEELYKAAFAKLDSELFFNFRVGYKKVHELSPDLPDLKSKIMHFLALAWNFILRDEARCRCFVRFYYSVYFAGDAAEAHDALFSTMISEMAPAFKEDADVVAILHSVFTMMFDFAIRVYNGAIEDNENNRPHIFAMLYNMMAPYIKDSLK